MPMYIPGARVQTAPMMANLAANRQAGQDMAGGLQSIMSAITEPRQRQAEDEALVALSQARTPDEARGVLQSLMTQRGGGRMTGAERTGRQGLLSDTFQPQGQRDYETARLENVQSRTAANRALAASRGQPEQVKETPEAKDKRVAGFKLQAKRAADRVKKYADQINAIVKENPDIETWAPTRRPGATWNRYEGSDSDVEKKITTKKKYDSLVESFNKARSVEDRLVGIGQDTPQSASTEVDIDTQTAFNTAIQATHDPVDRAALDFMMRNNGIEKIPNDGSREEFLERISSGDPETIRQTLQRMRESGFVQ